ncbi:MAG: hypothetical protein H7645_08295 [Candidatus Heimdallarchaeota archaeon]|nr:hypothetical protein [Candidatus Heimdallarchaeota archaeon]MCK4770324.1 hypothetical protein [Candidatus Heimdallarchaeota archaeon]
MSEEFDRCSNCGNLNIKGTKKCVFCDFEIAQAETEKEEKIQDVKDLPSVPSVPSVTATPEVPDSPDVPEVESKEVALPEIPEAPKKKEKKKAKTDEIVDITETKQIQFSIGRKFLFVTLFTLIISTLHYGLNLLISFLSINFIDADFDLYPTFPSDLTTVLNINSLSIILGIPFAIFVGFFVGKVARTYSTNKSGIRNWIIYAIFIDVIVNCAIAVILIFATQAFENRDILLSYLSGAVIIFAFVSLISLFIPFLAGSYLVYNRVDRIFFPRKYSD